MLLSLQCENGRYGPLPELTERDRAAVPALTSHLAPELIEQLEDALDDDDGAVIEPSISRRILETQKLSLTLIPHQPCILVPRTVLPSVGNRDGGNDHDEYSALGAGGHAVSESLIQVAGIEKAFGEVPVLNGVDFEVVRGTIFALLGSNGAGKTTLVRILSTLLRADAGTATVGGFDITGQAAKVRQSISLTGQFAAVDEMLTGRENLMLVARLRRSRQPGRVADEMLDRFALTDAGGRRASEYSGGMRRRLDIAMSLIGDPAVVFLDEPTTGLDPERRIEVWEAIKQLAQGGTTILLTTQQLDEAEELADRIAILHEGRILTEGTLAELKRLLPPAKVEYVEKQPTLEDVFLALVGTTAGSPGPEEQE